MASRRGACLNLGLGGVLALAALLRGAAMLDQLQFDEIASVLLARRARSAAEVLFGMTLDNNHPLNTLFLYAMGDQRHWAMYRLLSFASGCALVALAWLAARPRGARPALLTAVLCGGSFVLITYASEARGYSLAMLCSVALLLALRRALQTQRWGPRVAVWALVGVGTLSHLAFANVYLGLALWSVRRLWRSDAPKLQRVGDTALLHGVPLGFLAIWQARGLTVYGGPRFGLGEVFRTAASLAAGGPQYGFGVWIAAAIAAVSLALALLQMALDRDDEWLAIAASVIGVPLVLLLVLRPELLAARYLMVGVPLCYLAWARLLDSGFSRGGAYRQAAAVALAAFLVGNGLQIGLFLRDGRGHYLEALQYIERNSPGPVITVASDNDTRNATLLYFYGPYLSSGKRIRYVPTDAPEAADWAVLHSWEPTVVPPTEFVGKQGAHYRQVGTFPYYGLSGWNWYLYRREPAAGVGPSG